MELKTAMSVSEALELFGILGAIVDECRANLSEVGGSLKIKAADPANVALVAVDFVMNPLMYNKNEFAEQSPVMQVGLDIAKINSILKPHEDTPDESVRLQVNPQHKLEITIGCITRMLLLPDPAGIRKEPTTIQAMAHPVKVELTAESFRTIIESADVSGEYVVIGVQEGTFYIKLLEEKDSMVAKPHTISLTNTSDKPHIRSNFSLEYLMSMAKAIRGKVMLEVGNDTPLRISWQACSRRTQCSYLLAPCWDSCDGMNDGNQ